MAAKPRKAINNLEVIYGEERWKLLHKLRCKANRLLKALENNNIIATVHGSLARGDVNKNSDVDIFVHYPPSSFAIETALEKAKIPLNSRVIIQATPNYGMKAHIEIDPTTGVSFPLMKMRKVEREFYKFGGEITFLQLQDELRMPGVDKRLMLIEPTERGHFESSIINRESYVAEFLHISIETVQDRIRTLLRRDQVGRTGVFIKEVLGSDHTFEMVMKRLADGNPAVRRRLRNPV